MRWTAYHLVCMVGLFVAGKKLQNNRGTSLEASQFFFKILLALPVSHTGAPTNASTNQFQYLICAGVGRVSLASLPYFYASVNMLFGPRTVCLATLYRFYSVWAACEPFSVLPSHSAIDNRDYATITYGSASFQTVRPGL